MSHVSSDQLLARLRWRYATKQFDAERKIPADLWNSIEELLRLTPSSFGLQPWKFIVIENPELRAQLREASWGQSQVTDASHLVVFTSRIQNTPDDVQALIDATASARDMDVEAPSLAGYKQVVLNFVDAASNQEWNARQLYIALGNLLTSAALLGVDACPLEGISPSAYDDILGLNEGLYRTSCAVALGYRNEADPFASLAKVRFESDVIIERR